MDPKYDGVRVSRTELEISDHTDAGSSDAVPDAEDTPVTSEDEEDRHEDAIDGDSEQAPIFRHRQADEAAPLSTGSAPQPQPENDLASTLKRAREEERKKGKAVARQLVSKTSASDDLSQN